MAIALLLIIYLIFISLGLPDSMLGSSFPAIAQNLSLDPEMAGYVALVVSFCTIISSLLSATLIEKLTTKWVVSISILLTAVALIMISFITKETASWAFYVCAIPLGLGAGAIDAALNNYVALHYKAIHMNWLHCSWGVGASIGPLIIGSMIDSSNQSAGWNKGVMTIAIVQFSIAAIVFATLPLWNKLELKKTEKEKEEDKEQLEEFKTKDLFKNPIFYLAMTGFFAYCALETMTGLWTGSFFCYAKGLSTSEAATLTSLFYIGITVGRFICGPLSLRLNEKVMIRIGEGVALVGGILASIPVNVWFAIVGLCLVGIGCAPIYPAIIRSTPYRFSRAASQKAMGLEMAIAYCGNLAIPPLYGLLAKGLGDDYSILPYGILIVLGIAILCHEIINARLAKRDKTLTEEEKKKYRAA
jgi:fucose permease